jgi:hypothetical protein
VSRSFHENDADLSGSYHMSKTLKELAQEALAVQDACNLCGVAQSFARAMRDLGDYTKGTDERNQHPVTIVWLDKLNQLAGIQTLNEDITRAYNVVHDLAGGA